MPAGRLLVSSDSSLSLHFPGSDAGITWTVPASQIRRDRPTAQHTDPGPVGWPQGVGAPCPISHCQPAAPARPGPPPTASAESRAECSGRTSTMPHPGCGAVHGRCAGRQGDRSHTCREHSRDSLEVTTGGRARNGSSETMFSPFSNAFNPDGEGVGGSSRDTFPARAQGVQSLKGQVASRELCETPEASPRVSLITSPPALPSRPRQGHKPCENWTLVLLADSCTAHAQQAGGTQQTQGRAR